MESRIQALGSGLLFASHQAKLIRPCAGNLKAQSGGVANSVVTRAAAWAEAWSSKPDALLTQSQYFPIRSELVPERRRRRPCAHFFLPDSALYRDRVRQIDRP